MLEELSIQNIALIDKAHLVFHAGFNVLSGETGAGKSILVGALGLVLGKKADAGIIREGADSGEVNALIKIDTQSEAAEWLAERDIPADEDGYYRIRRVIVRNKRGNIFLQGTSISRTDLEEFASFLFDMHSQHEHQSLFVIDNHRKLLDRFGGIEKRVSHFRNRFNEYNLMAKEIAEGEAQQADAMREEEFLKFGLEEIDQADLREDEEEEITSLLKRMENYQTFAEAWETILNSLSENRGGAVSSLRQSGQILESLLPLDSSLTELNQRYQNAFYEIEDIVQDIAVRQGGDEFSPAEMERLLDRQAVYRKLKKKYGPGLDDVLDYADECRNKLGEQREGGETLEKMIKEKELLSEWILGEAEIISDIRKKTSESLGKKIQDVLFDLGMVSSSFRIDLSVRTNASGQRMCGASGSDRVEFLFSANKGETLKPLKAVASGGELSRVMLAMKAVLAESDEVETFVFDEIDSGIGGEVALKIGAYMKELSRVKQIFSITHLASIASFADNQIKVLKKELDGRTLTQVEVLEKDERVKEIARMLSGDSSGEESLSHAEILLNRNAGR